MDTLQLSLRYIAIKTSHIDEMVDFYTQVVGLHALSYENDVVFLGTAVERQPILMLIEEDDVLQNNTENVHHLDHFAFQVNNEEDLYALFHRLRQQGISHTELMQKGSLRHLFFEDYDHNRIEVYYQGDDAIEDIIKEESTTMMLSSQYDHDKLQEGRLGHVHLSVSELEKTLSFYQDILSLSVIKDKEHHHTTDENKERLLISVDHHHDHKPSPIDFIAFQVPSMAQLMELKKRLEAHHYAFYFNVGKRIIQLWDVNHISYWFQAEE